MHNRRSNPEKRSRALFSKTTTLGAGTLVQVHSLSKYFTQRSRLFAAKQLLKAVDNVSVDIMTGETLVLMGESGCGKTTFALTIVRLLEPTSGDVTYKGTNLFALSGEALRRMRRYMQVVLQDPLASLDPRLTLRQAILEPLVIHQRLLGLSRSQMTARVLALTERVGLKEEELDRYPRDLSGGQQQRGCICRALAAVPEFLVLDEPTSSLDVSVQARVLNLLLDLRRDYSLTYLFVTHDAAVARYVGDRVGIMYLGNLLELGAIGQVLDSPLHPYTKGLIGSVLSPYVKLAEMPLQLKGTPEAALALPLGCVFQRRCAVASDSCYAREKPKLVEVFPGRFVACTAIRQPEHSEQQTLETNRW